MCTSLSSFYDCVRKQGKVQPYGDLEDLVHPLFSPSNFSEPDLYPPIEPSLRLLTKLCKSPQVVHYLYGIFFGINERTGLFGPRKEELEVIDMPGKSEICDLKEDDFKAVEDVLICMSRDMVTFHISDRFSAEKNGWCIPRYPRMSKGSLAKGIDIALPLVGALPGVGSDVYLNKAWLDAIASPHKHPREYTYDNFTVAITLLHELGHAVNYAAMGRRHEDFFIGSGVAEAGFEIQARLFGGVYQAKPGEKGNFYEWPNKLIERAYNGRLPSQHDSNSYQGKSKAWNVSDTFLHSVFQEVFWQWAEATGPISLVPQGIADTVRAAMMVGGRMPVPDTIADLFKQPSENDRCHRRRVSVRGRKFRQTVRDRTKVDGICEVNTLNVSVLATTQSPSGLGAEAATSSCM